MNPNRVSPEHGIQQRNHPGVHSVGASIFGRDGIGVALADRVVRRFQT